MYPLVISFHTPDEIYSEAADILRKSLDKFGLDYEIDCIEPLGNYQAICRHKAVFIKEKLLQFPRRPVCWLDADSEIVDYPVLLENIEEDIASVKWKNKSLLISILYCANNSNVKLLMDAWIEMNEKHHEDRNADQENLERLIKSLPDVISFKQLPETYAYVPGESKHIPDPPVILQYLASRTKKGYELYQ